MLAKKWMLATGSCVVLAAMLAPSVMAQNADDEIETIVVTGIRGSLEKSAAIKRDSKQIVDVITAEDVGKLPDNNVPEALAHVTGVQIERTHGEGSSVSIRGMTNVATTLNGNSASVGESRSMDLSDIPAELLKSVTVYKSRSADQVEGGIAGTVNVDLRRPLDLDYGLTIAGSVREVNASIGNTWSPYTSLLVSDRFSTGLGDMGFLLNVSYTQNSYNENYFYNESPNVVSWSGNALTADTQNTTWKNLSANMQSLNSGYGPIAPYAVYYGFEHGTNTRPSVNLSTQWRVNDNLDMVLEGSYISSLNKNHADRMRLQSRTDGFTLSNIVLLDNTASYGIAKSYSFSNGTSVIPAGPESVYDIYNSDEFNTNFEMHWHSGRWAIDSSAQYNWSAYKDKQYYTVFRFNDAKTGTVDFSSDKADGGPYFTIGDVDLTDANAYDLYQYHDQKQTAKSQEIIGNLDVTYNVSEDWFLRSVKVGTRYNDRHTTRNYGYRDAFFWNGSTDRTQFMPVSEFPCGSNLEDVKPDMKSAPTWKRISTSCIVKNNKSIRDFIVAGMASGTVTSSAGQVAADWSTAEPSDVDLTNTFVSHEFSLAGYALANWAFTAYIPFDGQVGARIVNTWGDSLSTDYKWVDGVSTLSPHTAKKDYTDVLPNANFVAHLTDKLQMRVSYFYQIDRPSFLDSSSWQTIDTSAKSIWEGNPTLKPMREHNYDATLEYFFGKAGQVSAGYFLKKPHGWIYYSYSNISSGEYAGYKDYKNRNASPGTFEGWEFTAQSFFDFLPGIWSNFGASANATLMTSFKIKYPYSNYSDAVLAEVDDVYAAAGTSRYTYNLALYYDTPQFSTRVSYNYRAKWRTGIYNDIPGLSTWNDPTSRLDAAVNWTPYKWVTFSLEGANLLEESNHSYWGKNKYLPESTRMQARTIQLSARFRY